MYDRLLIPFDGSDLALAAVRFAAHLPSRQIRLLRVEPPFQMLAPGPLQDFRPDWREVRAGQVRDELAPVVAQLAAHGAAVAVDVRFGDAAAEIIAAARETDLIVMSTRGQGAAGRIIFGSTADRVVRYGTTPVLLLRGGAQPVATTAPTRVVVLLDGSPLADEALPAATALATELGVPIHLLTVVAAAPDADLTAGATAAEAASQQRTEAEAQLQQATATLADAGATVSFALLTGAAFPVILDATQPGDVIVLTSHGRGGMLQWLLGSLPEKLIQSAEVPVVLVPVAARQAATAAALPDGA